MLLSPAAATFDMFEDYAARGRAFIAAVGAARRGGRLMSHDAARPRSAAPHPASGRRRPLQRERHEPEYGILVAIVALAAIGILMVYSSSAIKAFLQRDDTFAIVGPQILWAALGIVAMVVMMRVDYRWLRVVSVPLFIVGVVGLVLVFIPADQHRGRRLGALAQDRAAAGGPPGRVREARAGHLPRPLVREAGQRASAGCWSGTVPFLVIVVPVVVLVLLEPDLGTSSVLALTAFTMFFLAGREPPPPRRARGRRPCPMVALMFLRGYQMDRITAWLDPWADPLGIGFHSDPGLPRARRSAGCSARGSARAGSPAGCSCPTRATTTSSRSSARSSGCSAAGS